jgi:hypothetical protein
MLTLSTAAILACQSGTEETQPSSTARATQAPGHLAQVSGTEETQPSSTARPPSSAPSGPEEPHAALSPVHTITEVKEHFNLDADKVRIITILSPT